MPDPKFLQYKAEDHERARDSTYIRDFVEYVESERTAGAAAVLEDLRTREFERAYFKLAKVDALGALIERFYPTDAVEEAPQTDEEWHDPAMPIALRGNHAADR